MAFHPILCFGEALIDLHADGFDNHGFAVRFVPFAGGQPNGAPVDFVTGFQADGKTMGRPVGVTLDPKGALIVADDLSNTVWRVTPAPR